MSYGISIQNSQGLIQIDENYSNYQLYQTGTLTTDNDYPFSPFVAPYNSLLLIRPTTYEANIFYVCDCKKYTDRTEFLVGALGPAPFGGSALTRYSRTVSYLLFVDSSIIATSVPQNFGYGLNVFKADDSLVYSSNIKTVPFTQATLITNNVSQNITVPTPSGKTTYIDASCLGKYGFEDVFTGFTDEMWDLYNSVRFPSNTLVYYNPVAEYVGGGTRGGSSNWFTPRYINFGAL
jgi:hypothetical protein